MNKILKIILYLVLAIIIIFGILVFIGWKTSSNKSLSGDDCRHIIAPGIPGDLGHGMTPVFKTLSLNVFGIV
jgi:hypothetical protein